MATTSNEISYSAAVLGIGVTLASILLSAHRRSFAWAPFLGLLLLIHPYWWMDDHGMHGNIAVHLLSVATSLAMVATLICQIAWPRLNKHRFLLGLTLSAWAFYLLNWPIYVIFGFLDNYSWGLLARAGASYVDSAERLMWISLGLSAACLVKPLRDWIRPRSSPQLSDTSQYSFANTGVRQTRHTAVAPLYLEWRSHVRVVSIVALVTLVLLYGVAFALVPALRIPEIFYAFGWSAILSVAAARGRLF